MNELLEQDEILRLIHEISLYQDGIMLLVRQETNPDIRLKLLQEYDKAELMYKQLEERNKARCKNL